MKITITLLLAIFLINGANAQSGITAENLQQLGRLSDPQISPDGKDVIYNVRWNNLEANAGQSELYKVNVSSKAVTRLTNDDKTQASAKWNKDGTKIFFLNEDGDAMQLFEMKPDGSNVRRRTNIPGGLDNYGLSADNTQLWFTAEVKIGKSFKELNTDLPKASGKLYDDLMYRHWTQWADENYSHVFTTKFTDDEITTAKDLMPGEKYDCPLKPNDGEENIAINSNGTKIAYSAKKLLGRSAAMSTNSEIYIYDLASSTTFNLTEGMNGYDKNPLFSPDGNQLIWSSMETPGYESDRNRLMLHDFTTKKTTELSMGLDYNVEQKMFSNDGKKIYCTVGINATEQIYVFDLFAKKTPIYTAITSGDYDRTAISITTANKSDIIVLTRMDMSHPVALYHLDLKTKIETLIADPNSQLLTTIKMGKVEKRMIASTDGKQILTWVIFPPNFDPSKKYPTLLYCQGGPQSTVSQFFSYRWNFQLMASHGYIIVAPNRRGLPSFGENWNDQITGDWGGQAMRDLTSAIDSVANEPYVDKEKLGAVGASFGGYSVYWLAGHHNKRFKTFISHNGVFNLEAMNATEELFFNNHDFKGEYWNNPIPRSYTMYSPHRFVGLWDTPILVIANEKDYRVPYTQGLDAFNAARLRNIDAQLLTYPDEGHWVLKPQNSVLWQRVFFNWLDKYLK
ncbi:MAG: hypothetical protein RIQ89_762 [Bacteroidota bacterium]|jgi:dipeptidyl aminopeptidase/acylaminoacyl peptidase